MGWILVGAVLRTVSNSRSASGGTNVCKGMDFASWYLCCCSLRGFDLLLPSAHCSRVRYQGVDYLRLLRVGSSTRTAYSDVWRPLGARDRLEYSHPSVSNSITLSVGSIQNSRLAIRKLLARHFDSLLGDSYCDIPFLRESVY